MEPTITSIVLSIRNSVLLIDKNLCPLPFLWFLYSTLFVNFIDSTV